jgi:hypothetical protein
VQGSGVAVELPSPKSRNVGPRPFRVAEVIENINLNSESMGNFL